MFEHLHSLKTKILNFLRPVLLYTGSPYGFAQAGAIACIC